MPATEGPKVASIPIRTPRPSAAANIASFGVRTGRSSRAASAAIGPPKAEQV